MSESYEQPENLLKWPRVTRHSYLCFRFSAAIPWAANAPIYAWRFAGTKSTAALTQELITDSLATKKGTDIFVFDDMVARFGHCLPDWRNRA